MNISTKKARKGYVISRETSGGFSHVNLSFVRPARYDADRPEFSQLRMRWQSSDRPGDRSEWYAQKVTIEADSLAQLAEDSQLAAKIDRAMTGPEIGHQPADYVAQLEKMGFVRYVWDRRVSPDLVEFDRVLPITWRRFMADYTRLGWDSCVVATVAADEETAKPQLLEALAKRATHWNGEDSVKKTLEFLTAGSPVKIDGYASAPDLTATADIVRSPKDRDANESAAA